MNFCKVGKSEVAMPKAMLALLQQCCKQCPKGEVLFHMGLSNTAPQGDILSPSELRVLQLLPQKEESSYCITDSKLLQLLMQVLLVSASTYSWYIAFILKNHPICHFRKCPENRPFPSSSECSTGCARLAALQWSRHTCSEASITDAY